MRQSWLPLLAVQLALSGPCEDPLDWAVGRHVPFDRAALQRSVAHIGDLRRLRPVLTKLSTPGSTVVVLVIGGSIEKGAAPPGKQECAGCLGHLWHDVLFSWLHNSFPAEVVLATHLIAGAPLRFHLEQLPKVTQAKPDLIIVETSLYDPLHGTSAEYRMNQTPVYLEDEVFIRALLQLPHAPAVIWMDLMTGKPVLTAWSYGTNQEPDSVLTEYYDVPQVSVRGAWYNHLPFEPTEIWTPDLVHPRLLGHKMIAVTLVNFLCHEFLHACDVHGPAPVLLPDPLFYTASKGERSSGLPLNGTVAYEPRTLEPPFCKAHGEMTSLSLERSMGTRSERLAWSLAVALAIVPLGLFHLAAAFLGLGNQHRMNTLPQYMPELEWLRIMATVNIVAFQYYQEIPPPWSRPAAVATDLEASSEVEGTDTKVCVDFPTDWKSSSGMTCDWYVFRDYCTPTGLFGPGWDKKWGGFHKFASSGISADTACCGCGGGLRTFVNAATKGMCTGSNDASSGPACTDAVRACSWCRSGKYWIQFFFLLSGLSLTLSGVKNGVTTAVWNYAQIWPLHALALLIASVSFASPDPLELAMVVSLVHTWVVPFHSSLNGASWYPSTLLAFWIAMPTWIGAATRLTASQGAHGIIVGMVLIWLCTLLFPFLTYVWPANFDLREVGPGMTLHNFIEFTPYANWPPFVIGILLACLIMLGVEPRTKSTVAAFLVVASLGLFVAWFVVPSPGFTLGDDFLLLDKGFGLQPIFVLLVLGSVGMRQFPNPVHRLLVAKPVLHCAKLCWPMFILHQPVHALCTKALFPWMGRHYQLTHLFMALYPIVLVVISIAAARFIDQPWIRFIHGCRKGKTVAYGPKDKGKTKESSSALIYEEVNGGAGP